ncbi:MAG: hypothetical protein AMDU5_GPLC00008G0009 [Thermoplasmatales archaeon Gpl]|nr:MAG: hypothetical protein AMDU5_GPLC00008G0009 [Thermoplasmatales archaeon Gpl]
MNKYLLMRKVIQDISMVLVVTVIIFIVFRLMPGNPAELFIPVSKTGYINPEAYQNRLVQLGLQNGKYSLTDFVTYLHQMFTFNWGKDYVHQGELVSTEIALALPYTLVLIGSTAILSFAFGIPFGIWCQDFEVGRRRGSPFNITYSQLNTLLHYRCISLSLLCSCIWLVSNKGPNPSILHRITHSIYFNHIAL